MAERRTMVARSISTRSMLMRLYERPRSRRSLPPRTRVLEGLLGIMFVEDHW
jgi:hypothetical protein